SAPSTASASKTSVTTTSTAPRTSSIRRASSSASRPTGTSPSSSCAISTWTSSRRCGTAGSSTETVARRCTTISRRPEGRAMPILITNGTVVSATGAQAMDVLIDGETIAAIYAPGTAGGVSADKTIDATGKYVIPGGVDAHTHMELPFGGTFASDTFET